MCSTHLAILMRLSVCHLPDTSPTSISSVSQGRAGKVTLKETCSCSKREVSTFNCNSRRGQGDGEATGQKARREWQG